MTDLTELLDRASGAASTPIPISDDLARAHAALRRHRRQRRLVAVGAVCVAAIGGVLAGQAAFDDAPGDSTTVTETPSAADTVLFAADVSAGPYTFGKLPRDWEVQGEYPQGVTIAEIGDDDQEPLSFLGKLVIMYDRNPPSGAPVEYNGREFYTRGDSDHHTVAVRTRAGEPEGVLSVQYPDTAGWDFQTMIEFLDAVLVGAGARPGVG